MRILLIGEMPGKRGDPKKVLDYRVFDRLRCDRVNLFEENVTGGWHPRTANYQAREVARINRMKWLENYDRVIFVGKRVAAAFRFRHDYFEWQWHHEWRMPPCCVFPHPSGLNRWWNSESNRTKAETFVGGLAYHAGRDSEVAIR